MRKAARSQIALGLGLVLLTACQSADRSPVVGPTVVQTEQEQGRVRAAADPVPVPGAPNSVPVPGGPGGSVPVPGRPAKNPPPGSQPTPAPTATPTVPPTPIPVPAVKVTFTSTDVPKVASGPFPTAASDITVSGITGPIKNLTVAFRATIPDDTDVDDIHLRNPSTASNVAFASLYSDTNQPKLSGSDLGNNCTPFGGATTIDDKVGGGLLSTGTAPYAGVFRTDGTLTGLAAFGRTPADANGVYRLSLLLEAGGVGTLECWTLIVEYQP